MSDTPKEGGMLEAGGGWGGGGGGPWDGMVGVVDDCRGTIEVRVFSQQGIRFVGIGNLWDGSYLW